MRSRTLSVCLTAAIGLQLPAAAMAQTEPSLAERAQAAQRLAEETLGQISDTEAGLWAQWGSVYAFRISLEVARGLNQELGLESDGNNVTVGILAVAGETLFGVAAGTTANYLLARAPGSQRVIDFGKQFRAAKIEERNATRALRAASNEVRRATSGAQGINEASVAQMEERIARQGETRLRPSEGRTARIQREALNRVTTANANLVEAQGRLDRAHQAIGRLTVNPPGRFANFSRGIRGLGRWTINLAGVPAAVVAAEQAYLVSVPRERSDALIANLREQEARFSEQLAAN